MSATAEGGRKTRDTNKSKYGSDFYARIGRLGGIKSRGGGFSGDPEAARLAGAKGGKISSRNPKDSLEVRRARVDFQSGMDQPTKWEKIRSKYARG